MTDVARGKLKIFFGAFPGAGKTGAMLAAARRMKAAGRDVVIGFLDLHGKDADAPMAATFETVPSSAAGELDLDAVIARHAHVVLIDDLAHRNPQGARHPQRWNDVDEILDGGIDVFTTMSVQHLASLNDVVSEITGIPEHDTVPDTFFDTADETIMVDMSADELLLRLAEGSVPVSHVKQGSQLFRKGALLALREIALRRVADVVEDEVLRVRADQAIVTTWKTHGRMLCCIGPDQSASHVVRSAARLAGQLDEEWTAVYVETPALQRLRATERARILEVVSLAQELGAKTAILTGNNPTAVVVDYAREHNISTVVVGRSRPGLRLRRTMSDAVAAAGDHFDVIEIGRTTVDPETPVNMPSFKAVAPIARRGAKRARYGWTLLACIAVTAGLTAFRHLDLANIAVAYMLMVVLIGVRWGRGPAVFSALLDVLLFDFFFVPPRLSFLVNDPQYFLTFAVMLVAGVIVGQLAGGIRYQASVAAHREKRARTLYEFTRDISDAQTTSDVIERTELFMARQFRALVAVLVPDATGALVSPTSHGMKNPADSTTAQWAYEHSRPAGAGTDTLAGSEYIFLPLKSAARTRGVLAFRPERSRDLLIPEQRHQFDVFAALVATALERVHFMDVARDAMLMARIQGGDLKLELQRKPLRELVDLALKELTGAMSTHPVTVDVPSELPLLSVDPPLMGRVLSALIGNVAKHTPAETPIAITARVVGESLEIAVEDQGPGMPSGREEEVFETFQRGEHQPPRKGAGLGLAISRAIVEAHGGTIQAESDRERGARVVVTLPLKRPQASVA